jgi:fermentation-respiration switch protein FrsA (DUF1100 family)
MLLSALTVAAAAYVGLALLLYLLQPNFIFFPQRALDATPADRGLAFEEARFATGDGLELHGWYVAPPSPRAFVLFFHGNAGNISHRLENLAILHALGLATLIFDYRGYGQSEGEPDEDGTYEDARAAWRYLAAERGIAPERIIAYGQSLGGAVATRLATERRLAGLVIESSFTSVADLAHKFYPYLPTSLLTRVHYPTRQRIPTVSCPVLVMHSPDDDLVPFAHGEQLYEAAREPKRFQRLRGGHNDAFITSGEAYWKALDDFVNEFVDEASPGHTRESPAPAVDPVHPSVPDSPPAAPPGDLHAGVQDVY